jgi:hypothetical protein
MNNSNPQVIGIHGRNRLPQKQRGISLILFTIGMLIIVFMGGLALDMSHAMLNKTRLQNTVDAAALAAATSLNSAADLAAATQAAEDVFTANQASAGNSEMLSALTVDDVTVQFSATLEPFTPGAGADTAEFVRVIVEGFSLPAWLIQVWQRADGTRFTTKTVRASAVAGPSPSLGAVCDLVPLIVCGDPDAGGPFWGYEDEQVVVLKGGADSGSQSGPIGPGNFQLAQLGGSGMDVVRENLAGGYEGCALEDSTIPTQTGVGSGPVAQGINTRLGKYEGAIKRGEYPPDVVTETPDTWVPQNGDISYDETSGGAYYDGAPITYSADLPFNYDTYIDEVNAGNFNNDPPVGIEGRRNLTVTIAQCDGDTGNSDLPILGFGCFFMLQEVKQKGNEAEIYGEWVQNCDAKGNAGPDPTDVPGPQVIQLYNDVDSKDS